MTLSDRRVDLWLVCIEEAQQAGLLPAYRELLSAEERERAARFRRPQDRDHFVVARALLRCTLSRHVSAPVHVTAPEWRFRAGACGKPYLAPNPYFPHPHPHSIAHPNELPHFNLTHTEELVLLAVTLHPDVDLGVDAEPVARELDAGVVDQCLTHAERAALNALPTAARLRRFTEIWTLKEAFAKARGDGLSLPLHAVEFAFPGPGQLVMHRQDARDDGRGWRFIQFRLPADHIGALCIANAAAYAKLEIVLRRTVPLVTPDKRVELDVIRASTLCQLRPSRCHPQH